MTLHAGLRFEGRGEVLRRRVSLLLGALLLFATSLVLGQVGAPGWGAAVEQGLAVWLLVAFSAKGYRAMRTGVVHADASGVRLGDALVAHRSAIAAAFLVAPEDPVVRIVLHRALSVDVKLESEEQARAFLRALGLGIGESIATFSAWYGGRRRSVAVTLAAVAGAGAVGVASSALVHRGALAFAARAALLVTGIIGSLYLRSFARIDVGGDGVLVRRLGEQRFIAYGSIAGVSVDVRQAIVLALRTGEEVRLSLGSSADKLQLRDALVHRIEEARAAFVQGQDIETAEALVAPSGRAPERWLREVRAMAAARDYRETRLDEERLWRVVDDSTAPAGTRAGAAVALSALDQTSRTRLRVAAEACAEPRLRVALTRVAEGASDAELEEALTPLLEAKS